jgi:hypothetical protein
LQDYIKIALGVLKLDPRAFYCMNIAEFNLALEGHLLTTGQDVKKGMSKNEMLDLIGK